MQSSKTQKKILIRVDGNDKIGYGHLYRTIALAKKLSAIYSITFLTKERECQKILQQEGFCLIMINNERELFENRKILNEISITDFFVMDGYQFKSNFHLQIKSLNERMTLIQIDDNGDCELMVNAIINHNAHAIREYYPNLATKQLALGENYLLLRDDFFQKIKPLPTRIKNIFVVMGGADPKLIGFQIAKIFPEDIHVTIISNQKQQINRSNTTILRNLNAKEMAKNIYENDLTISSVSMTAWEAIAVTTPLVLVSWVENQLKAAQKIAQMKLGQYLGHITDDKITKNIEEKILNSLTLDYGQIIKNQQEFNRNRGDSLVDFFNSLG